MPVASATEAWHAIVVVVYTVITSSSASSTSIILGMVVGVVMRLESLDPSGFSPVAVGTASGEVREEAPLAAASMADTEAATFPSLIAVGDAIIAAASNERNIIRLHNTRVIFPPSSRLFLSSSPLVRPLMYSPPSGCGRLHVAHQSCSRSRLGSGGEPMELQAL